MEVRPVSPARSLGLEFSYCNKIAIRSFFTLVNFVPGVFALALAGLVGALSLSSVSSSLHDLFFHGETGCPHSASSHPCGSQEKEQDQEREEELPCPVLLFAEGYLLQDFVFDLSASQSLINESGFVVASHLWVTRNVDPFGARDPPFRA